MTTTDLGQTQQVDPAVDGPGDAGTTAPASLDDALSGLMEQTDDRQQQQQVDPAQQQAQRPGQAGQRDTRGQQGRTQGAGTARDLRLRDGTIVPGGEARRHYERAQGLQQQLGQAQQQLQQHQQEVQQLRQRVQEYEHGAGAAQRYGLDGPSMDTAARVLASFRANPVQTLNWLVQQAKAAGHDLRGLGGPGVDTNAIRAIIQEEFAPLRQRQEMEARTQEARNRAAQEASNFFMRYPDAKVHEPALAVMVQRDPSLSPTAAYYMLRNWYTSNGHDWSIPVSELTATPRQQPNTQARANIPQGRGSGQLSPHTTPRMAGVDESLDQIVRQVVKEAGIN